MTAEEALASLAATPLGDVLEVPPLIIMQDMVDQYGSDATLRALRKSITRTQGVYEDDQGRARRSTYWQYGNGILRSQAEHQEDTGTTSFQEACEVLLNVVRGFSDDGGKTAEPRHEDILASVPWESGYWPYNFGDMRKAMIDAKWISVEHIPPGDKREGRGLRRYIIHVEKKEGVIA